MNAKMYRTVGRALMGYDNSNMEFINGHPRCITPKTRRNAVLNSGFAIIVITLMFIAGYHTEGWLKIALISVFMLLIAVSFFLSFLYASLALQDSKDIVKVLFHQTVTSAVKKEMENP